MNEQSENIVEQMMHLVMLIHRYHAASRLRQGPFDNPYRGQGRVISILKMKPEISQKELSYLLDMSRQSLAELLSKLEACGYITRTPSSTDGRAMNIMLTQKGKEASEEMEERDSGGLFESLTSEEQKQFCGYLERLIQDLTEKLKAYGPGRSDERQGRFGNDFSRQFERRNRAHWGQEERRRRGEDGRQNPTQKKRYED